jgi:hypothetical protein
MWRLPSIGDVTKGSAFVCFISSFQLGSLDDYCRLNAWSDNDSTNKIASANLPMGQKHSRKPQETFVTHRLGGMSYSVSTSVPFLKGKSPKLNEFANNGKPVI